MLKLLISTFSNSGNAENAIQKLSSKGLDPKTMSVITHDKKTGNDIASNTGSNALSSAKDGALTGAAVGAAAGLLVGLGAISIPGLGGLLVAGPIASAFGLTGVAATTATGAVAGSIIGGVAGALVNLGLPDEEAKQYETEVNSGATLVIVPIHEEDVDVAKAYIKSLGADRINLVNANDQTGNSDQKIVSTSNLENVPRMRMVDE